VSFDAFEKFAEMRRALSMLEAQLQQLLHATREDTVAQTPIHAPGPAPYAPAAAKPPKPHPGARDATPSSPFNDPFGWQGPPPPSAKQLPATTKVKSPAEARALIARHIEDIRAMAVHMHNCAGLLLAMSDVLETALALMVRRKGH
jgi:hypothetical protein